MEFGGGITRVVSHSDALLPSIDWFMPLFDMDGEFIILEIVPVISCCSLKLVERRGGVDASSESILLFPGPFEDEYWPL